MIGAPESILDAGLPAMLRPQVDLITATPGAADHARRFLQHLPPECLRQDDEVSAADFADAVGHLEALLAHVGDLQDRIRALQAGAA